MLGGTECLSGRHILVVEDEYILALDICEDLEQSGATVIGPVASVGGALRLIEGETKIQAAVLDINLRGELAFEVAQALRAKSIPFVFATGYEPSIVPDEFSAVPLFAKPLQMTRLLASFAVKNGMG
jgi:CheY-like chemotaxis protein